MLQVVCKYDGDQDILGMHFLGPNAGEVMQGFAVAMRYLKDNATFLVLHAMMKLLPCVPKNDNRLDWC